MAASSIAEHCSGWEIPDGDQVAGLERLLDRGLQVDN